MLEKEKVDETISSMPAASFLLLSCGILDEDAISGSNSCSNRDGCGCCQPKGIRTGNDNGGDCKGQRKQGCLSDDEEPDQKREYSSTHCCQD